MTQFRKGCSINTGGPVFEPFGCFGIIVNNTYTSNQVDTFKE